MSPDTAAANPPAGLRDKIVADYSHQPTVTPEQRAAALRLLTRRNALDLADMLGLNPRPQEGKL